MPEHIDGDCMCWGCVSRWADGRRRPLELTFHPPLEPEGTGVRQLLKHSLEKGMEQVKVRKKHLNEAELAAEYFSQEAKCRHEYWIETVRNIDDDYTDAERAGQQVMDDRMNLLYRFATLPHYWESE